VSDFTPLDAHDVRWAVRLLPKALREMLKETGSVLAGGFIRAVVAGEKPSDIDLFVPNPALAESVARKIADSVKGSRLLKSPNAWTVVDAYRLSVQIIHRWTYPDADKLVESFDFTVSRAAIWWENGKWHSTSDRLFYVDLAAKRLVYSKPQRNEDAGGSMLRVLKFYQRGYRIPLDSLGDVVARLMSGVREEDLAGVVSGTHEEKVARCVTSLLVMVDPNIDVGAVAHLPSRDEPVEDEDEVA
jgi:hypothetical protein